MKKCISILCLSLLISCQYEDYDDSKVIDSPLATCIDGIAAVSVAGHSHEYSCSNYDLMSYVTLEEMDAEAGNDCWGWTDSTTGREYAIMGINNGTAFIDITDSTSPVYLGKLPTSTVDSAWRDMKVYNDHVYIVSEAQGHGLQVFNLSKLRGVESKQVFSADYIDNSFGQAHNIAINEDLGYAYIAGSCYDPPCKLDRSNSKGLYIFDLKNPLAPEVVTELPSFGYSHDAHIVTYKGPDQDYVGKEIYVGSNEDRVDIVDVTNKMEPKLISSFNYDHQYTHQSWLTEDHKYALLGDEVDETIIGVRPFELLPDAKTRTIIINLTDLDDPKLHYNYFAETKAIDHNGYVKGTEFFLASYTAGLRVLDILNIDQKSISEIGFFNTYHDDDNSGIVKKTSSTKWSDPGDHIGEKGEGGPFSGAWSVYPYFKSENIIISDINSGLFVVKKQN